jgi:hypothetical protein
MAQRITRGISLLLLLILPVVSAGCDSDESDPTVTGSWGGTANVQGSIVSLDMQLTENSGSVTGSGTLNVGGPIAINVTGTHNYPSVALTVRSTGFADLSFQGTLSGDARQITGTLSGSGFDNFGITLAKR